MKCIGHQAGEMLEQTSQGRDRQKSDMTQPIPEN